MTSFPDDDAVPAEVVAGGPPAPALDVRRLWAGGIATAIIAALIAFVGDLLARALFDISIHVPGRSGAGTLSLCLWAAGAALAATGLVHVLVLTTPHPRTYFHWIVGLATVAAMAAPLLAAESRSVALATALLNLVLGAAIGSLVSGIAASATYAAAGARSRRVRYDRPPTGPEW